MVYKINKVLLCKFKTTIKTRKNPAYYTTQNLNSQPISIISNNADDFLLYSNIANIVCRPPMHFTHECIHKLL